MSDDNNDPTLNPLLLVIEPPPGWAPGASFSPPEGPQQVAVASGSEQPGQASQEPLLEQKQPVRAERSNTEAQTPQKVDTVTVTSNASKEASGSSKAAKKAAKTNISGQTEAAAPSPGCTLPPGKGEPARDAGSGPTNRNPLKPRTMEEIAFFRELVVGGEKTLEELGKQYGTTRKTISKWAKEFKTGRTPDARRSFVSGNADTIGRSAEAAVDAVSRAIGRPLEGELDPKSDPAIKAMLARINAAVPETGSMADLGNLQKLLLKLLTMVLDKGPITSWASLGSSVAEMYRMILYARRVEAEIPATHDPVALRQDAARQLLQELGAVLSKEDQDTVSGLLRKAAGVLKSRNGHGVATVPEVIS